MRSGSDVVAAAAMAPEGENNSSFSISALRRTDSRCGPS